AVEPQPICAKLLREAFRKASTVRVEEMALGVAPGNTRMFTSRTTGLSSLSPDWIRAVQASGRFAEYEWDRSIAVRVDTLDHVIAVHGRPTFIKIDVEGFEEQVLSGLSVPVQALSFEFSPEVIDATMRCIQRLSTLATYDFQVSLGESMQ